MKIKRIIAAASMALFSLSFLLTPAALANNNWNNNWNHNNWNYRDAQKLKACLRILDDNRVYGNNNWHWDNNRSDVKFCINLLNDRHDWKDNNNWDKWSNHSDRKIWDKDKKWE